MNAQKTIYITTTVANLAGGDLRTFRLRLDADGRIILSGALVRHADRIGYGGPVFSSPDVRAAYDDLMDHRAEHLYG